MRKGSSYLCGHRLNTVGYLDILKKHRKGLTEKQRVARARKGGLATKAKYGFVRCNLGFLHRTSEFYAQSGANGGTKTFELYGLEHMSEIGKKGGRPRREDPEKIEKEGPSHIEHP